ncbi:inhibitor of growth proteins N-terminal histone-binding-domain-containing protein [Coemansia mojavensis]|nr:inhibitor of growth proteins N-terminal histone-binding-domain-containing protein [Coemansia mojavensis]
MLHLEEYLDTLEALPMELQRQFTLMRELDALSQDIQEQMKKTTTEFIDHRPTPTDPKNGEYLRSFIQLFSTVLKHGEEKVALATQTYDLVDKHIRKLDDDLAKFEERNLAMPQRTIMHTWSNGSPSVAHGEEEERRRDMSAAGRKRRGRGESPQMSKSSTPSARRNGRGGTHVGARGASESRSRVATSKAPAPDFSEMPIDPNEPRYCYCQQVSYGEMVACDDDNCEIEWFHLGCVDLKAPPKGQWFCRDCSQKHKRRRD